MSKGWKITLAVLAGLSLIALAIILYNATKPKPVGPPAPSPDAGGFGGAIGTIIAGLGGWLGNLFGSGGSGASVPVVECDPDRIGYNKDGTANPNCGKDYTGCDYEKCDPNRSGWNMCGIPDNRCY